MRNPGLYVRRRHGTLHVPLPGGGRPAAAFALKTSLRRRARLGLRWLGLAYGWAFQTGTTNPRQSQNPKAHYGTTKHAK